MKYLKIIKPYFSPFSKLSKNKLMVMLVIELIILFISWSFGTFAFLPKPLEVLSAFFRLCTEDSLLAELWTSLLLCIKSMAIATLVSALITYMSTIPAFRYIALFVSKGRFLSLVGLSFFFVLLTSSGDSLKTSLLCFSVIVFFVTSFIDAIDKIDDEQYTLARTLGMNEWKALWYVVVRGKLSVLLEVVRQNFAMAWLMLSTIEVLSRSGGGIGVLLVTQSKYLKLDSIFAIQIMILILGILMDYGLSQLRLMICPETKYEGIR